MKHLSQQFIYFGKKERVVKIVATQQTTWILTSAKKLYGCGLGTSGQQGNGSTTAVTTFTKRASNVKDVCSSSATWYVTNDGDLYGCGRNTYGQQGSGDTTDVKTFTKRASNVKSVVCSDETTWYVTNDGDLYGCGRGDLGQQGNGSSGSSNNVLTFSGRAENVFDAFCSSWSSFYITNNGDLYGCGYSNDVGDSSTVKTFTKIKYKNS